MTVFRTYPQIGYTEEYLLIFLLLGFGDFFLIDYELAAILASAIDVQLYGLYKRLLCLLPMT